MPPRQAQQPVRGQMSEFAAAIAEQRMPDLKAFDPKTETGREFVTRVTQAASTSDYWRSHVAKFLVRYTSLHFPDLMTVLELLGQDFSTDDTHLETLKTHFIMHFDRSSVILARARAAITNTTPFTEAELSDASLGLKFLRAHRALFIRGSAAYLLFINRLPDSHRFVRIAKIATMQVPDSNSPSAEEFPFATDEAFKTIVRTYQAERESEQLVRGQGEPKEHKGGGKATQESRQSGNAPAQKTQDPHDEGQVQSQRRHREAQPQCTRCGRPGHTMSECFAKRTRSGNALQEVGRDLAAAGTGQPPGRFSQPQYQPLADMGTLPRPGPQELPYPNRRA